jgi:hypothetical protein
MIAGASARAKQPDSQTELPSKASPLQKLSPKQPIVDRSTSKKSSQEKPTKGKVVKKVPRQIAGASKKSPAHLSTRKPGVSKYRMDVWISLVVHGFLLVILGAWVVVTVQNTPTLSVVAATVESNEVLIETPMESISELDTTAMETSDISSPDTSEIQVKVDTDAISVEKMDLGIESLAQASALAQQISRAGAPGNKVTEGAEFFGSKATGNRFVYIVDASPSMRRDRAFDAAKEEILRSLRSMKSKQRFAILFFGGEVQAMEFVPGEKIDEPVQATGENIENAVRWLQKMTIQKDGKPPIEAVKTALEFEPDGIFLLFDGATKLDNWTQVVRKLNTSEGLLSDGGTQVPIHVIHFFRDEFQRPMQLLAHENGGTYRFVPSPQARVLP